MRRRIILPILLLLVVFPSAASARIKRPKPGPTGPLKGCRVVMVIAPKDFKDEEFSVTRQILAKEGARIIVAAQVLALQDKDGNRILPECTGTDGLKVRPDVTISETLEAAGTGGKIDVIVFVGGMGSEKYADNPEVLELARIMKMRGKIVTAICLAPTILGKAGVLKGKKATVWEGAKDKLEQAGAIYENSSVVSDGRIVTANGPKAAKEFAETIKAMLLAKVGIKAEADKFIAPALALAKEEKFDEAHAKLDSFPQKGNPRVLSRILLAKAGIYHTEKKNVDAIKCLDKIPAGDEIYPRAVYEKAAIYLQDKNYAEAAKPFNILLSIDADDFDLSANGYYNYRFNSLVSLGIIGMNRKNYFEALDSFLRASHLKYTAFHTQKDEKEAKSDCALQASEAAGKLLELKEEDNAPFRFLGAKTAADYLFALGMEYYNSEKKEESIKVFKKLAEKRPKHKLLQEIPEEIKSKIKSK